MWSKLNGSEGTITAIGDWTKDYIIGKFRWTHEVVLDCNGETGYYIADQLEPTYDGYQKTSWDAMKDILAPEHYFEKA